MNLYIWNSSPDRSALDGLNYMPLLVACLAGHDWGCGRDDVRGARLGRCGDRCLTSIRPRPGAPGAAHGPHAAVLVNGVTLHGFCARRRARLLGLETEWRPGAPRRSPTRRPWIVAVRVSGTEKALD